MPIVAAQSGRWIFKAQLRTKPLQICLFQLARTRGRGQGWRLCIDSGRLA